MKDNIRIKWKRCYYKRKCHGKWWITCG